MNLIVDCVSKSDWAVLSEHAHRAVFSEVKPAAVDRIDFALLVRDHSGPPHGYVTCREHDAETLYWQFGGAFPGTKDTAKSFRSYTALVEWCKPRYKRLTTIIENSNTVMLKMAMKVGFKIVGIRFHQGSVLIEHLLEFDKGENHGDR
jgi:hypothetical protein